jgi:glutaredoxin
MVEIITSEWCTYCTKAKMILQANNIDYKEIDIGEMKAMELMVKHQLKTVPQIFYDGTLLPGGADGLAEHLTKFPDWG